MIGQLSLTVQTEDDQDVDLFVTYLLEPDVEFYEVGERIIKRHIWHIDYVEVQAFIHGKPYEPTKKERLAWGDSIDNAIEEVGA
jgi:hypothetical protein